MEANSSEQQWVNSFRDGDNTALSYFFKLHYKPLCYFVGRMVQNNLEAEDIVTGCFVKAWEHRQDFDTATNIKAFLYISSRNSSLNHLKHLKVKSAAQLKHFNELQEGEEIILTKIIEAEVLVMLNKEIEHLPDNYREVFKLLYFDQLKTDEIAIKMGINVQTVRNYKARAIDLLKASMLKKGISETMVLAILLFLGKR